jgi:hypothetical protein
LETIVPPILAGADLGAALKQSEEVRWKPAVLSAMYPGLGQFHNRQIFKGSVLAVMFTVEAYVLTGPAIKLINHSAELRHQDIPILVMLGISLLATWVLGVNDAWRTARSQVER